MNLNELTPDQLSLIVDALADLKTANEESATAVGGKGFESLQKHFSSIAAEADALCGIINDKLSALQWAGA